MLYHQLSPLTFVTVHFFHRSNDYENFLATLLFNGDTQKKAAIVLRAFNVEVAKAAGSVIRAHNTHIKLKLSAMLKNCFALYCIVLGNRRSNSFNAPEILVRCRESIAYEEFGAALT